MLFRWDPIFAGRELFVKRVVGSCEHSLNKGSFGCKNVRLNLKWKFGRKNAFLPDLTCVCGSTGCTDVCNLKPSYSNEELLIWTDAKTSVLACFLGGQRNIKNLWLKLSTTGIQPNSRLRIRLELQNNSILKPSFWSELATERPLNHLPYERYFRHCLRTLRFIYRLMTFRAAVWKGVRIVELKGRRNVWSYNCGKICLARWMFSDARQDQISVPLPLFFTETQAPATVFQASLRNLVALGGAHRRLGN